MQVVVGVKNVACLLGYTVNHVTCIFIYTVYIHIVYIVCICMCAAMLSSYHASSCLH